MGTQWAGNWQGGRVCLDRHGRRVYVIERQVDGRRRAISIGPLSETEALAELALFERSPATYRADRKGVVGDAVTITAERVAGWLAQLRTDGCSDDYRADSRRYIGDWSKSLADVDLRSVKLIELTKALDKTKGARAQRIAALRSLTRYLRDRGELEADASLLLHAPPPRPEKAVRAKGYTVEQVQRVYRAITQQEIRDVVCVRALTGLHHSEIDRVARGKGYLTEVQGQGEIFGTVVLPHKSGEVHIQSLTRQVFRALERLQRRGSAPDDRWVQRCCQAACDAAELEIEFAPGELRHSFITWSTSSGREVKPAAGGVPLATVSAAVGHRSTRTTRRFYDGNQVPPMVVVPVQLVHTGDPTEPSGATRS